MQSSSYSYRSSDSVFSNTTSTRTSLDSNENLLSVHCGPTLINSCISFSNESLDGHRYAIFSMRLSFLPYRGRIWGLVSSLTSKKEDFFFFFPFDPFRLDMLQQIATRVQRDSVSCEDKLILARNALQSVSRLQGLGLAVEGWCVLG